MIIGIGGFAVSKAKGPTGMWTPAALGANLGNWYDAADVNSFTLSNTSVTQWNDKSGNNRHATQSTPANRPVLTPNGLNSYSVVTFDGSNDSLIPTAFTGSRIQSTFVVFATNSPTTLQMLVDESNSLAYLGGLSMYSQTTGKVRYAAQDVNPTTDTTSTVGTYAFNIISGVENTSTRSIGFNGTIEATVTPGTSARNAANPRIGASVLFAGYLNGAIAEIVIANVAVSTTNRQKIEGYLAWKWGLVSKLPVAHPYKTVPPIV